MTFAVVFSASLSSSESDESPETILKNVDKVTNQLQLVYLNSLKSISQINAAGDAQINSIVTAAVTTHNFTTTVKDVNTVVKATVQKVLDITNKAAQDKVDLVNNIGATSSAEKRSIRKAYQSITKIISKINRQIQELVIKFTSKLTSSIDKALGKISLVVSGSSSNNADQVSKIIGEAEQSNTSNLENLYNQANSANSEAAAKIADVVKRAVNK